MRKLLLASFLLSHYWLSAQSQKAPVIIPGQYIVVLKESFAAPVIRSGLNMNRTANAPNKEMRKQNLDKIKNLQSGKKINSTSILFNYADAIVGFSAKLSDAEVIALRNDPAVQGVYQDQKIHLEYIAGSERTASSVSQKEDCAITTAGGHADGSSKFTWIWIMDSGIDTDHPDLNVQSHAPYAAYFAGNSIEDVLGHGTHVAGIAAAKDNSEGVVGISAGAKVVPVKVIGDDGNGVLSSLVAGLDHVAQYSIPGDVVNMSVGWPESCALQTALTNAMINLANTGVWMCSAAGNSSTDANSLSPACFNNTRVFTVAAVDCQNNCASFTNIGSSVDWYAAGVDVYSTYLNGGYTTLSGTSMATPVVAGIIHSRGQAPIRGPLISCQIGILNTTKPLARRQ